MYTKVFSMYIFLENRVELVSMIDFSVFDATFCTKPCVFLQESVVRSEKLVDGHEFYGTHEKMYIEKTLAPVFSMYIFLGSAWNSCR